MLKSDAELEFILQLYSILESVEGFAAEDRYRFARHLDEYWCACHPSSAAHSLFLQLIRQSAENGYPPAQFEMYCLTHFWGLFPDSAASKWLKLAAKASHIPALLTLAEEEYTSPIERRKLLQRAANLGSSEGARELGKLGLKGNLLEGFSYLLKAEAQGDAESALVLAQLFQDGSAAMVRDDDLAIWYIERALDLDADEQLLPEESKNEARIKLAKLYLREAQNDAAAVRAFVLLGDVIASRISKGAEAEFMLGCLFRDGRGTSFSAKKAIHFMQTAAEKGHAEAKLELARLLHPACEPDSYSSSEKATMSY